jgi:LAS superfamily LD-carboxypeptidase LdcB
LNTSLLAQLTGTTEAHLQVSEGGVKLHRQMLAPWEQLQLEAREAGFDLQIASGFRSFERQRDIWRAKATGLRPLYDDGGVELHFKQLAPEDLLHCLLRWSALPGTSRHHWGTDVDVYDASAVPDGYQLQLVPQEYEAGGPFAGLTDWLSERIKADGCGGFFRPYEHDTGGVAIEPWHLSYQPLAVVYQGAWSAEQLHRWLEQQDWPLAELALAQGDEIYTRYFASVGRDAEHSLSARAAV